MSDPDIGRGRLLSWYALCAQSTRTVFVDATVTSDCRALMLNPPGSVVVFASPEHKRARYMCCRLLSGHAGSAFAVVLAVLETQCVGCTDSKMHGPCAAVCECRQY